MSVLVSVLIPSYNHAKFIVACLDSVCSQNVKDLEVIVIDDGSKDDSVRVIKNYIEKNNHTHITLIHRENRGLCRTLNEGLALAKGKFLAVIASDDYMLEGRLEAQVNYLEENTNSAGCFGGVLLVDKSGLSIGKYGNRKAKYTFDDIFYRQSSLPTPTALIRTELLREVGGYSEIFKIEDFNMWLKLTESGKTLDNIGGYLCGYRQHESNMSSKDEFMWLETKKIIDQYMKRKGYKKALGRTMYILSIDLSQVNIKKSAKYLLSSMLVYPGGVIDFRFYRTLLILLMSLLKVKK